MRTTAIPSMLNVLAYNQSVKNHAAYLYEMATVYIPTENVLPDEPKRIVLGFYDTDRKDEAVFYRMKGIVDALMRASGIEVRYTAESDNPHVPSGTLRGGQRRRPCTRRIRRGSPGCRRKLRLHAPNRRRRA